jgi:hypothetical protein
MPAVLRIDGYDVKIFTHDHRPPHVHVFARGCEVVLKLNCDEEDISIRENKRFKAKEVREIVDIVQTHQRLLCRIWEELHGNDR